MLSPRAITEFFHLVFVRALLAKGDDKQLLALKGGCNLRFYFDSVRYSEDIDFDVAVMASATLRNKVERLLVSPLVTAPLRTRGVVVDNHSATKQTETTQRWKVGLRAQGVQAEIRTKIEFSRRGPIDGAGFDACSRAITQPYGLQAILATHYRTHAAIAQKIHALAERAQPQARDVFDLGLLASRPEIPSLHFDDEVRAWAAKAILNAAGISFDEYIAKVVAYLEPEHAELYEDRAHWNLLQDQVVSFLESLP